jgi:hypothetical protein
LVIFQETEGECKVVVEDLLRIGKIWCAAPQTHKHAGRMQISRSENIGAPETRLKILTIARISGEQYCNSLKSARSKGFIARSAGLVQNPRKRED